MDNDTLTLVVRTIDDVVILEPVGMVLDDTVLDEKVAEVEAAGNRSLLFNLRGTTFVNSMGLATIFRARESYLKRGGRVMLCCINPKLKELLNIVPSMIYFAGEVRETEEDALEAFRIAGAN